MKPMASGQAAVGNRSTQIFRSNRPSYTKLGAFSPLSETTKPMLKVFVALVRDSKVYSLNEGTDYFNPSPMFCSRTRNLHSCNCRKAGCRGIRILGQESPYARQCVTFAVSSPPTLTVYGLLLPTWTSSSVRPSMLQNKSMIEIPYEREPERNLYTTSE